MKFSSHHIAAGVRVALAVGAICAVSTATATRAATTQPYTIYVIQSLTGSGAYFGQEVVNAIRAYESVANKSGGINGQPVHFEVMDDGNNPQNTLNLFNDIVAKHVAVILGPSSQSQCNAVAPLAASGPVVYCSSPGLAPPPGYVFAAGAEIMHTQHAMMKYAHDKGTKRLALIVETDATGQRSDRLLPITLAKPDLAGMTVVAHEHFEPNSISVAAQVARIKAANPDFVYVSATGTPFQTVLRGLADGGVTVPVATSSANMDIKILEPFNNALPKELVFNAPRTWGNTASAGSLRATIAEYQSAYKALGYVATPNDDYGWDPAKIVVAALRKIGPDATAAQLRDFIVNLRDFPGIGGTYDFSAGDQHGLGDDAVVVVAYDPIHRGFNPVSKPGGAPLTASR